MRDQNILERDAGDVKLPSVFREFTVIQQVIGHEKRGRVAQTMTSVMRQDLALSYS